MCIFNLTDYIHKDTCQVTGVRIVCDISSYKVLLKQMYKIIECQALVSKGLHGIVKFA